MLLDKNDSGSLDNHNSQDNDKYDVALNAVRDYNFKLYSHHNILLGTGLLHEKGPKLIDLLLSLEIVPEADLGLKQATVDLVIVEICDKVISVLNLYMELLLKNQILRCMLSFCLARIRNL